MSDNEKKLSAAAELAIGHFEGVIADAETMIIHAKAAIAQIREKQTAPEPPKHPAQVTFEMKDNLPLQHFSYMYGFKDALLWAAEQGSPVDLSSPFSEFLKDTANTVPL